MRYRGFGGGQKHQSFSFPHLSYQLKYRYVLRTAERSQVNIHDCWKPLAHSCNENNIVLLPLPHSRPKILSLVMTEQHELSLCHCHHCWVLEHSQWLCCTICSDFLRVLSFFCQGLHKCPSHDQSSCCSMLSKNMEDKTSQSYSVKQTYWNSQSQMTEEISGFYPALFEILVKSNKSLCFFFPNTAARALSSYPTNKYILGILHHILCTHTNKYLSSSSGLPLICYFLDTCSFIVIYNSIINFLFFLQIFYHVTGSYPLQHELAMA